MTNEKKIINELREKGGKLLTDYDLLKIDKTDKGWIYQASMDVDEKINKRRTKMNNNQRYLLIAIAILLTIAILFPPFYLVAEVGTVNRGFHFFFSDQTPATVNIGLLFMEWLFIACLGFIGWLFFKDGNRQ